MKLNKRAKATMEEVMASLPFVEWDRFVKWDDGEEAGLTFYGWIERNDKYKDFVTLTLDLGGLPIEYMTSSAKYSRKICAILFGVKEGHENCRRVEDHFTVPNVIHLSTGVGK